MEVKWCMQDHLEQIQPSLVLVEVDQLCWLFMQKTWVPKSSKGSYYRTTCHTARSLVVFKLNDKFSFHVYY